MPLKIESPTPPPMSTLLEKRSAALAACPASAKATGRSRPRIGARSSRAAQKACPRSVAVFEAPYGRDAAQPKERLRQSRPGGDAPLHLQRGAAASAEVLADPPVEPSRGPALARLKIGCHAPSARTVSVEPRPEAAVRALGDRGVRRKETGAPQEVVDRRFRLAARAPLALNADAEAKIESAGEGGLVTERPAVDQGVVAIVVPREQRIERIAEAMAGGEGVEIEDLAIAAQREPPSRRVAEHREPPCDPVVAQSIAHGPVESGKLDSRHPHTVAEAQGEALAPDRIAAHRSAARRRSPAPVGRRANRRADALDLPGPRDSS